MGTEYKARLYNTSGVLQAEITDFTSLAYTKKVNDPGYLYLQLSDTHPLVVGGYLADKWPIQVYRRNQEASLDWTLDFTGLIRKVHRDGRIPPLVNIYCPGVMSVLGWRVVAWYAGTLNRSEFSSQKAETIAKTLVTYNATSSATTTNGRLRNGSITGLTVQTDAAGGNNLYWYCSYDNLLKTLQELAAVGGGDFDVVATAANAWNFRWYAGQLGTDRSTTVIFSLDRGNMGDPQYKEDRSDERTVAIVGGPGEGSERAIQIRTGSTYSTTNDIEMFADARNEKTGAGQQSKGDRELMKRLWIQEMDFKVLQTPSTRYGIHYFLGDKVKVINPWYYSAYTLKIVEVSISTSINRGETIQVRTDVP